MKKISYSLYLITDRNLMTSASIEQAVEQAILGGVTIIQLREKNISSKEYFQTAVCVKKITDRYNVPLIINDRIDIALAAGADGVHLGQSDIPASTARKILGADKIIGVTAPTIKLALKAQSDSADYIGVGAMFPTSTKEGTFKNSKENLIQIRKAVDIPIVAIGGINLENAMTLEDTGINGLAVVSAIIGSEDIKKSAEDFNYILMNFKLSEINEYSRICRH